ncbi:MAG TPA: adenylyltransferase/cytidyltransferase family protein [Candidatus Paceibacterota bacterium]|nr:adenylyltransferase/cytidyltransferase family protein [Candidatus Paceibacterota bacterium]
MKRGSIFADDAAMESRLILDEADLLQKVEALKALKAKLVLTSGSFDLPHIGHMRYLHAARMLGDFLIVGIDSDAKVRARKGKYRPIIPELERAEMIAHTRYADIITIKDGGGEKWGLIKLVRPDVLVISERTGYDEATQAELLQYCGKIENLQSQATTSTSAQFRRLQTETLLPNLERIRATVNEIERELVGEEGA